MLGLSFRRWPVVLSRVRSKVASVFHAICGVTAQVKPASSPWMRAASTLSYW